MKKIIFGTAAAIMMLSACETLVSHEGEISSDANSEKVVLTATVGNDTKVYLEQVSQSIFKTRWADEDEFLVLDRDIELSAMDDYDGYYGWFEIESGVGESTAQFVLTDGVLPRRFYAFYGGEPEPIEGTNNMALWLPRRQYRQLYQLPNGSVIQGFDYWDFPMFATGEGSEIHFQNLCSVLKLSVTGNGEVLNGVKVETLDEGVYLAGSTRMNFSYSRPRLEFMTENVGEYETEVYNNIYFDTDVYNEDTQEDEPAILSSNPVECYLVIPAQTYPSGLKITVLTEEGSMEVTTSRNLTFAASELREIPAFRYESQITYDSCWTLVSDEDSVPVVFTEEENGYLVLKNYYIDDYAYLEIYDMYSNRYGWSNDYYTSPRQLTNTCGQLQLDGNNISIPHGGYYDIYLEPYYGKLFLMSAGTSLDDIPTTDNVACYDYGLFIDKMYSNELVKVYGRVSAKSQRGFVMNLNGWDNAIFVYTYTSTNLSDDMKSMLSNIEVGECIEFYATTGKYYEEMPQLSDIVWCKVYDDGDDSRYYYTPYSLNNSDGVYSSSYVNYISYSGILSISGTSHNVVIDGTDGFLGSIYWPLENLSQYNGQKVYVEGYYIGTGGSTTKYVNTVLTKIAVPNIDGSTEDVIPDDDLVATPVNATK